MTPLTLREVVKRLQAHYGKQKAPKLTGPWEMILWENVAYLADDEQREQAFKVLKSGTGTEPGNILAASQEALLAVTRHGIMAERFAEKLRTCARLALEEFDGDLRPILKWPLPRAKKALQRFPGIGEPGAEKILVFCHVHPLLALDSNGLRSLLRLGFGEETKNYSKTYHLAQNAAAAGFPEDCSGLIDAHLLLRRHGQELCRRTKPLCGDCPLASACAYPSSIEESGRVNKSR
jgi:endonuclease III